MAVGLGVRVGTKLYPFLDLKFVTQILDEIHWHLFYSLEFNRLVMMINQDEHFPSIEVNQAFDTLFWYVTSSFLFLYYFFYRDNARSVLERSPDSVWSPLLFSHFLASSSPVISWSRDSSLLPHVSYLQRSTRSVCSSWLSQCYTPRTRR